MYVVKTNTPIGIQKGLRSDSSWGKDFISGVGFSVDAHCEVVVRSIGAIGSRRRYERPHNASRFLANLSTCGSRASLRLSASLAAGQRVRKRSYIVFARDLSKYQMAGLSLVLRPSSRPLKDPYAFHP